MSTRQLNTTVMVAGQHGDAVTFGPGDTVPDWAAAQITNPDVWGDAGTRTEAPMAAAEFPASTVREDDPADEDDPSTPPRSRRSGSRTRS